MVKNKENKTLYYIFFLFVFLSFIPVFFSPIRINDTYIWILTTQAFKNSSSCGGLLIQNIPISNFTSQLIIYILDDFMSFEGLWRVMMGLQTLLLIVSWFFFMKVFNVKDMSAPYFFVFFYLTSLIYNFGMANFNLAVAFFIFAFISFFRKNIPFLIIFSSLIFFTHIMVFYIFIFSIFLYIFHKKFLLNENIIFDRALITLAIILLISTSIYLFMGFGDPLESDAKQLLNSEQGNLLDFFLGLPLVFIIYIILHFKKHNFSLNQIIKNTFAFIASIFLLIYVILPKYLLSWAFFNDRFIPFFILFSSIFFRSKKIDNVLYVLLIFSFVYLFLILETTSPKNLPELPIYDGPAIMLLSTESMYLHKVANSQNICFISDLFFASGSNSHYILIYDDELTFQHSIRERLNPKNCTLVSEKIEQNMMHYEDLKYIITADMCDVAENFQHWDVITTPDSNTDNLFVFENPNYTKTEK